ncbi:phospholipase A2 inhibitor NAI-like [Tiliqua scincoides]|uniref:phospholipase A2 inhibitor NAI-like n=1 Tax=Tiliqua scincoides TaxID=71010 RepID=UPI0034631B63
MRALLGFFLLSVFLRTGICLECEVCSAVDSTCTGSMKTCDVGQDTCAVILSENSLAGTPIRTVIKTCESSSACSSLPNYMNFGQGKYVRTSISCCVGDACKTAFPQFPPAMTEPNGKQCQGCYSLSPFGCEAETVDCVGAENFCLNMVEKVIYGKFVLHTTMKGCVTEAVCAAKKGKVTHAGVHADIEKAECQPASLGA